MREITRPRNKAGRLLLLNTRDARGSPGHPSLPTSSRRPPTRTLGRGVVTEKVSHISALLLGIIETQHVLGAEMLQDGAELVVRGTGPCAGFVHVLAVVLVGVLPALQQQAAHLVIPEGEFFRSRHI